MKLRESGMPDEAYWETLFDVPFILSRIIQNDTLGDVFELGCGYGTFTIPMARRIKGTIRTVDIDPLMIERTQARAMEAGLRNVACNERDVVKEGFGIEPSSQDACLLFNILHCNKPVSLLTEAASVVRPNGLVLVIHWQHDPKTPRGPSMDIRPRPEQIIQWAEETESLYVGSDILDLPPWHYGIRFRRKNTS